MIPSSIADANNWDVISYEHLEESVTHYLAEVSAIGTEASR